jgi:hypothetical protein
LHFLDVRLDAPQEPELRSFYLDRLALDEMGTSGGDLLVAGVGDAVLRFSAASAGAAPFYHFALLIPGNRLDAAHAWLGRRARLLPDPDTGSTIFDFDAWDALACYCLDPVGNVVELIALRGVGEVANEGSFSGGEILGFSEVGLVVRDKRASAELLARERDLHVWDGEVDEPHRLIFIGERGRTLILSPPGRGWLPTGRAAEIHPVEVTVAGARPGETRFPRAPHRLIAV